jgi:hypothetical protein
VVGAVVWVFFLAALLAAAVSRPLANRSSRALLASSVISFLAAAAFLGAAFLGFLGGSMTSKIFSDMPVYYTE